MAVAGGVVVVAHGGRSKGTVPTTAHDPAVLRMIPVAAAIRRAVQENGAAVRRPRFRVRGWNGPEASPVADLNQTLDDLADGPVVLVGHSMGGRAVMRAAGHHKVVAVVGLAPWLPPGEPVEQLAGRRVLFVHGTGDRVTSPAETWAYADRAREVTRTATIEVHGTDHAMLRRARLWHHLAADFVRVSLGLPATGDEVTRAFAASDAEHTVL